jgi:hypothetical protein
MIVVVTGVQIKVGSPCAYVEPTSFRRRTAGVHQVADLRVRAAAPSDRGDVEPIAEVIHLPRLELIGAQLAQSTALEDGVGEPLGHLPRHVPYTVPARIRTVDRQRPGLACGVVGGCTDVVVQPQSLERGTGQVSQYQRLAPTTVKRTTERSVSSAAGTS